ncbi:DHA2 family efflux MFS transporter permease subunit [Olivibacter sitiensis]|uniref:DHA2 family efflux MFS transporter permease subunit n=1 Tax=Olivibacter sitiensis TaxID=376470 RepID=UPI0005640DA2|nr:DHA2 family efflux MFS transporter permease subunit [Olivibacter sitiensis]
MINSVPPSRPKISKNSLTVSLIVASALFMENLDSTVIATALPDIATAFGVEAGDMSLGITAYLIAQAVFVPVSGWIADRYGVRDVFGTAIIFFTLSSIACAFSQSMLQFTISRIVQGTAGALMVPVGRLAVLNNTQKKDLLTAIAYITWPALVAPVLGPPLGGFITTYFSWHWIFLLNVPLGAAGVYLTWRFIKNTSERSRVPLDITGFAFSGLAMAGFMYSLDLLGKSHTSYSLALTILVLSIAALLFNIWHSGKIDKPLIDYKVFKVTTFRTTVTTGSLSRIVIWSSPFLLPLLFQVGLGMSAFHSGMLYLIGMVGNLGMKPATIWITRHFGFKHVLICNGLLLAVSTYAFSFIFPDTPIWVIVINMLFWGMFRSLQFSSLATLAFADIDQTQMSNANTIFSTAQKIATGVGVAIGALALHLAGAYHHTQGEAQLADFQLAFIALGILGIIANAGYLRLSRNAGSAVSGLE